MGRFPKMYDSGERTRVVHQPIRIDAGMKLFESPLNNHQNRLNQRYAALFLENRAHGVGRPCLA